MYTAPSWSQNIQTTPDQKNNSLRFFEDILIRKTCVWSSLNRKEGKLTSRCNFAATQKA